MEELLKWIPNKRYVFMLGIDGKKNHLGRYRRREKIDRICDGLKVYKGYEPTVVDTGAKNRAERING